LRTKIQRWGNSLGLRIPRSFAEEADVGPGSEVDLSIQDGDLIVKPARRRVYSLKNLLRKVTSRNFMARSTLTGQLGGKSGSGPVARSRAG
jgi:antitoxin MazE